MIPTGVKATATALIGFVVFVVLLFLPAGTFDYWQAWLFITVFAVINVSIRERADRSRSRFGATVSDYLALTKPRTIHLVVGLIPAMLLAHRGIVASATAVYSQPVASASRSVANTVNQV